MQFIILMDIRVKFLAPRLVLFFWWTFVCIFCAYNSIQSGILRLEFWGKYMFMFAIQKLKICHAPNSLSADRTSQVEISH